MLADAHDPTNLLNIWIHTGGPLTDAEMQHMLGVLEQTVGSLQRRKDVYAATLIAIDTPHLPNAKQRQQLGEAARRITRGYVAIVNHSMLARGVFTAIRWISGNKNYAPRLFSTYDEARKWLAITSGYPAERIDALYAEARSKMDVPPAPRKQRQ